MNGQWTGPYSGTNSGTLVADLDEADASYDGVVFAYDSNTALPRTCALISIPKGKSVHSDRVRLDHVQRGSGLLLDRAAITQTYPGVAVPTEADVKYMIGQSGDISISWKTDIGTHGEGTLSKRQAQEASTLAAFRDINSWEDFVKHVRTLDLYRYAFRGHASHTWKLRTSFHRTGRSSLIKFTTQDMQSLHRHLSGLTSHRFNLEDRLDYAAFLNLAQHHGYPTPMLDWTQSPFVAAYFAFREVRSDPKVRILVLDGKNWNKLERAPVLIPGFLHMTLLEPLAINNPRALPQQSLSAVTNVDDLETYIQGVERAQGVTYLQAIDLDASERRKALQDLALMGITAGSMFPGLDGACLQLKERYFDL